MNKRPIRRERRELSAEQKAAYAEQARKVEAEFPPGQPVPPHVLAESMTLGHYFNLRELVADLRDSRQARGLSLADVQKSSGIDAAQLNRIETGEDLNPTINTLARYARAVGHELRFALVERETVEADATVP